MKRRRRFSLIAVLWLSWLCALPVPAAAAYRGSDRFNDVPPDSPYNEAIGWAVVMGITDGTGPTTFNPSGKCTVQAILKFLWAYDGRPPYSDEFFADVSNTFRDAADWAFRNGYETGQTSGNARYLSGGELCTRLRAVRYLWLMAGRPDGYREFAEKFVDVGHSATFPEADAVGWAVAMGITNGTSSTTFAPESTCTRGQIVTFLYRYDQYVQSVKNA